MKRGTTAEHSLALVKRSPRVGYVMFSLLTGQLVPPNPRNHTASPAHVMLIHSLTLFQVLLQNSTVHLLASSGAEVSLRGCDTYPRK